MDEGVGEGSITIAREIEAEVTQDLHLAGVCSSFIFSYESFI